MVRNRWHVPTQVVGTVIAILAWFLGHNHGGRQFAPVCLLRIVFINYGRLC